MYYRFRDAFNNNFALTEHDVLAAGLDPATLAKGDYVWREYGRAYWIETSRFPMYADYVSGDGTVIL